MASADDRVLRWVRYRSDDYDTSESGWLIGEGKQAGWADYGRWVAMRGILARTLGAAIDLGDARMAASVAKRLGTTARGLSALCDALCGLGAIDADEWGRRVLVVPDVLNAQIEYQARCRRNRDNVAKRYEGGDSDAK